MAPTNSNNKNYRKWKPKEVNKLQERADAFPQASLSELAKKLNKSSAVNKDFGTSLTTVEIPCTYLSLSLL